MSGPLTAQVNQNSNTFTFVTSLQTPQGIALLTTPGASLLTRTMVDLSSTPNYPVPAYHQSLFGGLKTFQQYRLGDYVNITGLNSNLYAPAVVTGGGAVTAVPLQSAISLTVTGAAGDSALLFTKTQHRYQAGRQHSITASLIHNDLGHANQRREWPYFDTGDGTFFALIGTTLNVVIRSSVSGAPVETIVPQASWNVDTLNPAFGNNPSGVTLDITKGNIYEIKFEALLVGDVMYFINGILVHYQTNKNQLTVPFIRCPTLPLAFRIVNTGVSAPGGMRFVCGSVSSDGGEVPPQSQGSYKRTGMVIAANTEAYAFSIRLSRFFPKAGAVQNRGQALIRFATISSETNRCSFRLLLNPALTDATFAIDPGADMAMDVDIAATAVVGGIDLIAPFTPTQGTGGAGQVVDLTNLFPPNARPMRRWTSTAADADVITMMVTNEQAGNSTIGAGLAWLETLA